jgi:signal transduction histidine kinase
MTISELPDIRSIPSRISQPWTDSGETPEEAFERISRRLLRLAFDVHDGPLQSLAAAGFGLSDLQERIAGLALTSPAAAEAARILADIVTELGETERLLRTLVTTLEDGRPEIPFARDILTTELERFNRRSEAEVAVHGDWLYHPDSRSQALTLEALIRESLTNIVKHSGATRVTLRLETSKTHVLLEIEDNGCGFEPCADVESIGLVGMRERVRLLGGDLSILSKPGGPTVIAAMLRRWNKRQPAEAYTAAPIAEHLGNTA